ncbi:MAG: class I SAM-dependent methyltransferase [Alphaproteobacteria bacterium]|nr:class I SAM-dependent methyltransferase [Alphaproteobacteria bacterium]
MKALVKKFLPRPALNAARRIQSHLKLVTQGRKNFDASNLRAAEDLDVPALLRGAPLWERDNALISHFLGGDDRDQGVNPGDRRAIYTLIAALKPARILEVGTHIGASTLYIAAALRSAGGHVTSVDILDVNAPDGPWRRAGLPGSPRENLTKLGWEGHVTFVAQPAQDFMASIAEKFDFIFLDGDHGADSVYGEVAAALRILNPGGLILLHDYYPGGEPLFPDGSAIAGPYLALERIKRENPRIAVLPLSPLPWPTKQTTHMTSLALLAKIP